MSYASLSRCLTIMAFMYACFMPQTGTLADDWVDCRNWKVAEDRAIRSCTAAISSGPQGRLAWAHLSRGIAYKRQGRNGLAMADFDRALALDPEMWEAFHARALLHTVLDNNASAISDWRQVLELNPDNPNVAKIRKILRKLDAKTTVPPATSIAPTCAEGLVLSNNGQCVPAAATHSPAVQLTQPVAPSAQPIDLAVQLQRELKRVGCYLGAIDGDWGQVSRSALAKFLKEKGLLFGSELSKAALDEARTAMIGYCWRASVVPTRAKPIRRWLSRIFNVQSSKVNRTLVWNIESAAFVER